MRLTVAVLAATALSGLLVASADAQQFGFAAPVQFDEGKSVVAVWPYADMDNNGLMDIVSVDTGHTLTVRRRTSPLGTAFASVVYRTETLSVGTTITDMVVAQLGDYPYPDVVLAVDGGIVVVRNTGPGAAPNDQLQLGAQTPLTAGAGTYLDHVRIADWDSANGQDIIGSGLDATGHGILAIFLNNGNGTWGAPTITQLTHPATNLFVGDVTHDNRPEVVVVYRDDDAVGVWQNPNDGTGSAANETIISLPTRPVAVAAADLAQHTSFYFPDLVVVGSARSADGTKNEITLSVAQNVSAIGSRAPAFGAPTTFTLPGVVGADNAFASDAYAANLDAGGTPEIVVADNPNGEVAVFQFAPTEVNGVVTSWGTPTITEYPCNGNPLHVYASTFAGSSYTDLVTCNDGGNGVNVLIGGLPATPLSPATNFSLSLGTGTGSKVKYAAVATGGSVSNGDNCRFNCRNANASVAEIRIRVQATTTPDVESSWNDLLGTDNMATDAKTGDFVLYQQKLTVGMQYFRTVSSAPNRADGLSAAIGPFQILPGPAVMSLTASLLREGAAGQVVHRGETVRETLIYRNDGDTAGTVFLAGRVPVDCDVANAGGGKVANGYVAWTSIVVPPHMGDVKQFEFTVGPTAPIGTPLQSTPCVVGFGSIKVAPDKTVKGKFTRGKVTLSLKPGSATADFDSLGVDADLTATITPNVTSQAVGSDVVLNIAVTNNTTSAMTNVTFVEHLRSDVEGDGGVFVNAAGLQIPGAPDVDATGTVYTFTFLSLAPGATGYAQLFVRSRWDHAPSGTITVSDYVLSGQGTGGAAAVVEPKPPVVTVAVNAPATSSAPQLDLTAGAVAPDHADLYVSAEFGEVPYAFNGETVQYEFVMQNNGGATADHVIFHGIVPPGTDLDLTSIASPVPFLLTAPVAAAGATTFPGPADVAIDFGNLPNAGAPVFFGYKVKIRAVGAKGAPKPGDVLTTQFCSLTSNSFHDPHLMRPNRLDVAVLQPAQSFNIPHKTVTHSTIDLGGLMTLTYTVRNDGDGPVVGVQGVFGFGTFEACTGVTVNGLKANCLIANGNATFDIGTVAAGAEADIAATVNLLTRPPANDVYVNTLDVTAPTKSTGATSLSPRDVEYTNIKCDSSGACLFVLLGTKALVTTGHDVPYDVIVGNMSDQTAHGVVVNAGIPAGTTLNGSATAPTPTVNKSKGVATWRVGDIPPHSTKLILLSVTPGASLTAGTSLVNDAAVTSTNAPAKVAGQVTTTFRDYPDISAAADATRSFYVNNVNYHGGNSGIDSAIAALDKDSVEIALGGADFTVLSNSVFVVPMGIDTSADPAKQGRGYALAFGKDSGVGFNLARGADLVDELSTVGTGGFNFVAGFADGITVTGVTSNGVACANVNTAADALDQLAGLIGCKAATEVVVGAGNGVDATGTAIVPNSATALGGTVGIRLDAAAAGQLGGQVLLASPGSVSSAGAGGALSGPAVATGTGKALMISGGAVVAGSGGNLVSTNGGNVVAAGAGNVVAQGAGNVVAQGAGNVVAQGAGNIVATGAGN